MQEEGFVTLEEAVGELASTRLRVLMLIKEGALAGEMENGEWRISRESMEAHRVSGKTTAAVPSCKTSCSAGSCGCKGA